MHNPNAPIAATDHPLWQHNRILLAQAIEVIDRLQNQASPSFNYAQAVGPHLRHIIEHYQALMASLSQRPPTCVDYDARQRAVDVQSRSEATRVCLDNLLTEWAILEADVALTLHMPLTTRLQSGVLGEYAIEVPTTLGRELLFLSSHTVHHFALLGHYCKAAGVDLGPDFGKAPSTLAFERQSASA